MRRLVGLVLGAVAGAALGFVVYLLLRETVIPYSLWSSDPVMWGIIALVAAACAYAGTRGGGGAMSDGGSARRGGGGPRLLVGMLAGLVAGGVAAAVIAIVAAVVLDISQREGAYAMGVVFVMMPMGAFVGAVAGAVIASRSARAARPDETTGSG